MDTRVCECMGLHDVTEVATDVEISASEDARAMIAGHGGRVFVWVSVHPGFPCALCLLETSFEPPRKGDLSFRRVHGPGFDVYLEATQRIWPKSLEFGRRRRRVEAYWNGLAWVA